MANTGYKSFTLLERYYKDDGSSTGEAKPNVVTDPDYIAPIFDATNCPPGVRYYNTEQTKIAVKNNCSAGESGTEVTLTAFANQFVSNVSLADANNQALLWLENNAQIYANNLGTCELINDSIPPDAPILSSTISSDGTIINLSWTIPHDNVGVTGYFLYKKVGLNGTFIRYMSFNDKDTTTYSDNALEPQSFYYYKIIAKDAVGNVSDFSNEINHITPESGPFCFVEGTLISLADGTYKTIESLGLNELLLSAEIETLNDTNDVTRLYKWSSDYLSENRITSPVTKISAQTADKTIIINNGLLEATPSHSQLIQRDEVWKFVPLSDVIVGDSLYTIEGNIIPITSISVNHEKRKIYPLTLNPSHTYFANGILTHNVKPVDV